MKKCFPLSIKSFWSKPDTGAALHQRNSENLTACSSYSKCKITISVLTPFVFPPVFRCNNFVCHKALTGTDGGRVTLAPGASKTEQKHFQQRTRRHQSGPTCVVSLLTHIAYRLLTCFVFLRLFSSTWYSDICEELWQECDSRETMHANRWRAEVVVDVATEKKKYLYVIISHFMCTI